MLFYKNWSVTSEMSPVMVLKLIKTLYNQIKLFSYFSKTFA